MNEAALTERLDERGWLDAARGPGCYALELTVPAEFFEAWTDEFAAAPPGLFDRFESAARVLYVGASTDVYARLCDHVNAEVRRAAVLRVCGIADVADVTPSDDPFAREYGYALERSTSETVVYTDGQVL